MTSEECIGSKAPRWYIVLFRLFLACYFIFVGVSGVKAWQADKAVFAKTYETLAAPGTQVNWFRSYLNTVIEPIKGKAVFTWLLMLAPLLLGVSLLLGLLTRLSTFLGTLLVLNVYLIKFYPGWDALVDAVKKGEAYEFQPMVYLMGIAGLAVLFFAGAGRAFGIDGIFWRNRMRAKLEPPVPERPKAAVAGPRPGAPRGPIPLSQTGPAKIEETVGDFPSAARPQKPGPPAAGDAAKPGQPGPGTGPAQ